MLPIANNTNSGSPYYSHSEASSSGSVVSETPQNSPETFVQPPAPVETTEAPEQPAFVAPSVKRAYEEAAKNRRLHPRELNFSKKLHFDILPPTQNDIQN